MRRERLEYDVLVIGAGPAGLACALSLVQHAGSGQAPAVCVLEKAAEPGLHILSGAIIDPAPLDALLPGWRSDPAFPLATTVTGEEMWLLTARRRWRLPAALLPPMLRHEGQLVGPLSALVRHLAGRAEAAGVEIFPGFAASRPLFADDGTLVGVIAGEAGLNADGTPGPHYEPGVEITARFVVLAEGARGNITRQVAERLGLFRHPVRHALGLKELWRLPQEDAARAGRTVHALGWPLAGQAAGGAFLYWQDARHLALGLVVHMDWRDPWLSPFAELQRLKTHPAIAPLLDGAGRIGYGARAIATADVRDAQALAFPGGLLVGDAFGMVDVARAQGVHAALESGRIAGQVLARALAAGHAGIRLQEYEERVRASEFWHQLQRAGVLKPLWARLGLAGLPLAAADLWWGHVTGRRLLPRLPHARPDHATLRPRPRSRARRSPAPDQRLVFGRDDSLALAGVFHRRGQPPHLKVSDEEALLRLNWQRFHGPEQRYCPAGVYRWRHAGRQRDPQLSIQAENCLHCKACDIKDPGQNLRWTPPEGGDGPRYRGM